MQHVHKHSHPDRTFNTLLYEQASAAVCKLRACTAWFSLMACYEMCVDHSHLTVLSYHPESGGLRLGLATTNNATSIRS